MIFIIFGPKNELDRLYLDKYLHFGPKGHCLLIKRLGLQDKTIYIHYQH